MIARIRRSMDEKDQGFTLIELLVVMVIIGILSAIAVPVFLNQRTKARETAAVADASNVGKEVATYFVDQTTAPTLTTTTTSGVTTWSLTGGATGKLSGGNTVAASTLTSATAFCVLVKTNNTSDQLALVNSTGVSKVASTTTACTSA